MTNNELGNWAVFENDECVNVMVARPSVIEDFQQKQLNTGYILAKTYGLKAGDSIRIGDFRRLQDDGSYKYFRNEIVGADEQSMFVYETKELIYLGE